MPTKSKNPILDRIKYLPTDIQYKILTHYLISEEVKKMQDEIMHFRINERENKIDKQTLNKNDWDEDKKYFTQNLEKREEENGYKLAKKWISEQNTQKQGGNKKNKPVIYKKKIILGKERSIYKISGSRKDYIKYMGNFITVKDFLTSMRRVL
jgi:hypothetical protein